LARDSWLALENSHGLAGWRVGGLAGWWGLQPKAHHPVKPVDGLAGDLPAFALQHTMDAAIAVLRPRLRKLPDLLLESGLIETLALIRPGRC